MENTEQQKARDPFSPLELGLPVVVTDTNGNRIGNVWDPNKNGLSEAMRATTSGGASKVYLDTKTGKFTNSPISTMDYSDGKIRLNVSNDVANADWYKKLVSSDTFKSLAKLYAQDPTGKTELELDDGSKKTINDLLKGYAEDIAKYSERYQHNVDLRTNISRLTDGALTLTDDDIVIMSNADGFSRESVSDSNAVFLPDSVKSFFEDYETFNVETGTLSASDFYKNFYYLDSELPDSAKEILDIFGKGQLGDDREALQDIGESDKDYAIDLVRLRVSQEMNEIVERLTFYKDDLTETEKAHYATEYAKCFSLYKTMTKDQPDSTAWTGFNIGVQNIALGIGDQVVTGVESTINFISGIVGGIGEAVAGTFGAMDGVFGFLSDVINNFFEGGFDKVNENFTESLNKVSESVERATGNGSMVDEYKQSVSELSQAIQNRQDLAAYLFEDAEYEMTLVYSNAVAMQQIGRFAGFVINQILITNPIGNAVGNAVSMGIANGAAVLTTGKTFSMLANMANVSASIAATATKASEATKYMKLLNQIGNVAKVAGFSANVYAQGVVDTFLENPALVDAMLTGATDKEIAEFQETLRWNVMWNSVGEFVPFLGKGGRKAMKAFTNNTKVGAVTQAFARKAFNRVTLRGRKIYEGIAEFMTRNVPEEVIEQTDAVSSATKKLNSMKRMQNLREEIIKAQEDIKNAKLFTGDGSWTENAKSIDDLIQKRIEAETKLGITKKLAIAEGKNKIVKNAGLEVETANISEQTAELTIISKKMKQTNLPGSFSKETGDYINDLYNRQLLEAKEKALASKGGLSKKEAEAFQTLKDRIAKYESSIPSEYATAYKTAVQNYMEANYRFYDKLYDFLSSDAGGNILTKEELARMRGGLYGAKYMRVQAVNFKGADDLADLLTNPSKVVEQGKVKMGDERFNRKTFSSDTTYLDPNYARDYVLTDYAEKLVGAERADAIVRAGRATSFQTDANGKILKTSKDISKAKKDLYKELEQLFSSSLKENTENLGKVTADSTAKKIKSFWSRAKRSAQREVKEILGLDTKGLKTYASTLNSEEIQQIANVYSMPAYSRKIRTVADLNSMYESLSPAQKKIVDKATSGEELSLKRWNDAVTNNNLDVKLSRQYIKDNNAIIQSPYYKDMVAKAREKSLNEEEALALRESRLKIDEAETEIAAGKEGVKKAEKKVQGEFKKTVRRTVTESVDATAEALIGSDNPYLAALIREYEKAGVSSDLAKKYIIYQWLYDNIEKGGVVQHIAFDYYSAPSSVSEIKASTDAAMGYSKNFRNAAESVIESKLNKVIAQVQEEGVEGLVDMESTVARTTKYLEDIADMYGKHQIVEVWDKVKGDYAYYQVDRSTYNLVMNYPTFQKNNLVSRTMARINSIARIGQITLRMASLVTQGFKDSFNAIVLGGWDTLLRDDPTAYKKLAEYIGQDTIDAFRKEMTPDAWKSFLAQAEWDGLSVAEAIAKSEINNDLLMAKIKGVGTSADYFKIRNIYNEADEIAGDTWAKNKGKWQAAYERGDKAIQKIMGWYDKTMDTVSDKVNFLHNARENFLRKQVYRQNFMDALASGKSLNQARNYAQYVMENATTNFSRGVAWGQNIVRSIPYFGAMLNGASSMIRLLEIDPVGVMMRFTTDIVIPITGLTVMSLQNEKDAEIYKNIPEWEKEQNLHWVIDGRTYTVPLPEELSKFILPIRHAVESMHDANDHAWGELLVNDILNMPTIPLNAIMMLDEDYINGDPTVADRLSALALDMFNTLAPTAARTAYIAQTGRDPYTGKQYDRTKLFKDANGEYQYMTTTEYDFCQDLANFFKGWGWEINPLMAQGLLNSLFGTGSLDLVEGIRDFASQAQQGEANFAAIIEPSLARAGNVLTGTTLTDERKAELVWYGLARELKDSKTQLLAPDGKLAKYAQDIDQAKTSSEQAKALEFYNAEVRNFQNSVMDKVKNYNARYGDFFNRYKFASTISYLTANLTIDKIKDSTSYYDARADAVDAMYDAGFRGASDYSVFGYANRNWNTGEVTFEYADPLVVSLTQNKLYYQGDDALRKIEEAIDYSGLKDEYNNEFYPAYSNALNKKDWTTANRLAADWDVKVIKEIKPIIDSYTVGELLNKSTVIDYLDNYIKVPSTTEGMGKGRYYSSKTGLNKNRGYAQSYIKKVYKYLQEKE